MPRRAGNTFLPTIAQKPIKKLTYVFQCPEGLVPLSYKNVFFLLGRTTTIVSMPRRAGTTFLLEPTETAKVELTEPAKVSMPRRAGTTFLQEKDCKIDFDHSFQCPEGLVPLSIWGYSAQQVFWESSFNAPKSWYHFLTGNYGEVDRMTQEFQCPEGLVPLPNLIHTSFFTKNLVNYSFNAPKGWYHFLTQSVFFSHWGKKCFNAPKGWYHFLSEVIQLSKSFGNPVSMPRRAGTTFSLLQSVGYSVILVGFVVSMPQRASTTFLTQPTHPTYCWTEWFQCPEGLVPLSNRSRSDYHWVADKNCLMFQCPEGLAPLSNMLLSVSLLVASVKFQCPEGLIWFSNCNFWGSV